MKNELAHPTMTPVSMTRPTYSDGTFLVCVLLCFGALLSTSGFSQELVPAAYTPAPVGINLVTLSTAYSTGEISFDPSLPIEDVSAGITTGSLAYGRTFGLAGRAATLTIIAPYLVGNIEGLYIGDQTSVHRSGIGDAVVRFGINLFGAPAMDRADFRAYRPRTLVGASLLVRAPTGEYDSSKLINIGTNRWGFKPEIGVVQIVGNWAFDVYVGGWFFTDNSDFYGGTTRSQDPMFSTQAHVRYRINSKLWTAFDVNYWNGGKTAINGKKNDDLQSNSRVGLTFAWQVAPQHGLRLAGSRGAFTRIGGDFSTIGLSYSYTWMKE